MTELTTAIKNICLNPTPEDHELIFELYGKKHEIDTRYLEIQEKIKSQEKIILHELQNQLNIVLVNKGYETIDTNIELEK